MKLSDETLIIMADSGYYLGDGLQRSMAQQLLAARKVVETAGWMAQGDDHLDELVSRVAEYDRVVEGE